MNIITMTAYRRPEYTKQVLIALSKCEGIGDWTFIVNVEPGHDEVISSFDDWDSCPIKLQVNKFRLGLNENTHDVMLRARIWKADIVVHIEDDIVLSPDALIYFLWGIKAIKASSDKRLVLVSGYNKPLKKPASHQDYLVGVRHIWTPWGWATEKVTLDWLLKRWSLKNPKCFTCYFKRVYAKTLKEIYPHLSRVQNIGYEMGENNRTPEWYRNNHRTNWVSNLRANKPFQIK